MKVSYYELLGMIKENKQPKKLVYNDNVYTWDSENFAKNNGYCITDKMKEIEMFNKDITILEPMGIIEEDKEIEELHDYAGKYNDDVVYVWENNERILKDKINELIREVNKLKKEGK